MSTTPLQRPVTHLLIKQQFAQHAGQVGELIKWKKSKKNNEYVASIPSYHLSLLKRFDGYLRISQKKLDGQIALLGGNGQLFGLQGLQDHILQQKPIGSQIRLTGQPISVVTAKDPKLITLCHSDSEILKELNLIAKKEKLSSRQIYGYISSVTLAKNRIYHHYHRGSIVLETENYLIKHQETIKVSETTQDNLENPPNTGAYRSNLFYNGLDEDIIAYEIRLFKLNYWSGRPYFI